VYFDFTQSREAEVAEVYLFYLFSAFSATQRSREKFFAKLVIQ
jgi:hypothetical protein